MKKLRTSNHFADIDKMVMEVERMKDRRRYEK